MFKRRDRKPFSRQMRDVVAPRGGWGRAFEYWRHRMQRLPDSPTRIALGVACGVYVSFTPFFGLHFVVAAALAWVLRANVLASAIGTFFGNPLTFPIIAAVSLELGALYFGSPIASDEIKDLGFIELAILFLQNVHELVVPYLVGGLAPGLISAVISYFIVKAVVASYQKRRRAKLISRAKSRIAAQNEPKPD